MEEGLLYTQEQREDEDVEQTLRPLLLNEYIGQEKVTRNLRIYIEAAKKRQEVVDHMLFYGPPGLGKTTLAMIVANEMGTHCQTVTAPSIERAGDLAAILANLNAGDVLFIDEIHRIPKPIEEVLYSAMEDFCIDVVIGTQETRRTVRLELPPFTLIGATTKAGMISAPLRDRFGILEHLDYYTSEELTQIVLRSADVFKTIIHPEGAREIAKRSRGTPRIANRLLKRVRDFAQIESDGEITKEIADKALTALQVDTEGLDQFDQRLLQMMLEGFGGGPVGLETICSAIGEDRDTVEYMVEPYLLQNGFIQRTPRGRVLTEKAKEHLKKSV